MSPKPNAIRITSAFLLMAGMVAGRAIAQGGDARIEVLELKTTLEVADARIQGLETRAKAAEEKVNALTQSAAAANAESNDYKERYERLRGLLEALGIGALENNVDQTQDRLLSALSDLRLVESQKNRLAEQLLELSEAALQFGSSAQGANADAAARLQKAISAAEATIQAGTGSAQAAPMDMGQARIVSLKPEYGIVVLNVGVRDGVKPGMPFTIYREDQPIARVLVSDVRNSVCGAVVQDPVNAADTVRVGDRGKVEATSSF
ncbi:MAG: hypothetical protein H7A55_16920 [Verrucomicrobiaceae bacterium]|nr:hypothetical protein [Verrucomicrobiaceae bacterium]